MKNKIKQKRHYYGCYMFVITDNGSLQQVLVFADNGSLQHVLVFSSSFFLFLLLISVVIALSLFPSCLPFFVLQSGIMHTFVLEELEQAEWPLLEFIKLKFVKEVIVVVLFLRESCCCVENLDCSPLANTEHQVSTEGLRMWIPRLQRDVLVVTGKPKLL